MHLAKVGLESRLSGLDGEQSASSVSKNSAEQRHAERLADPSRGPALRRTNFQVIEEPSSDSGDELEESNGSESADASESDAELAELLDDLELPALEAPAQARAPAKAEAQLALPEPTVALQTQPHHASRSIVIEDEASQDEEEDEDEDAEVATPKPRARDIKAATDLSPIHESVEDQ